MYLWGVSVLELDSHPDQYKGPDPRSAFVLRPITCRIIMVILIRIKELKNYIV